jgi:hypothetical protein
MAEQGNRKLVLKFVDDRKLRSVQVFVGVHEGVPNETYNEPDSRDEGVPAMMAKRGQEDNEQRHQTGIQGKEVVVGILAFVAYMLRRLNV